MNLDAYPSLKALHARMEHLECEVYGQSVEGRPLRAYRIPGERERPVVVVGGVHGLEFIGVLLAEAVARHRGAMESEVETWVVPVANPDAYHHCRETQGVGKASVFRKNAQGVDLNRNWDYKWAPDWESPPNLIRQAGRRAGMQPMSGISGISLF